MLSRSQVRAVAKTFYHDLALREMNVRDRNGIMRAEVVQNLMKELGYEVTPSALDDILTEMYEYSRSNRSLEIGSTGKGTSFEILRLLQQLLADCEDVGLTRAALPGVVGAQDMFLSVHDNGLDVDKPSFTTCTEAMNDLLSQQRKLLKDAVTRRGLLPSEHAALLKTDRLVMRRLLNARWLLEHVIPKSFIDCNEYTKDTAASEFWASIVSRYTPLVRWEEFVAAWSRGPHKDFDITPAWIHGPLQDILVLGSDGYICLPSFIRFLTLFGPFVCCKENFIHAIKLKCFDFHATSKEAEESLTGKQSGHYMVTLSRTDPRQVDISVCLRSGTVRTVPAVRDGLWSSPRLSELSVYLYFDDLITLNQNSLITPMGRLYESVPVQFCARPDDGTETLHKACYHSDAKAVEALLLDGHTIMINQTTFFQDPEKNSLPAWNGFSEGDRMFITNRRLTPILCCLSNPTIDATPTLEVLLRHGARLHQSDAFLLTPLYYAICYNQTSAIPFLVNNGCKTTGTNTSPLLLALGPGPFCSYSDNVNLSAYTPTIATVQAVISNLSIPDVIVDRALRYVDTILNNTVEVGLSNDRFLSDSQRAHNVEITTAFYKRCRDNNILWRELQRCLCRRWFCITCEKSKKKDTTKAHEISMPTKPLRRERSKSPKLAPISMT